MNMELTLTSDELEEKMYKKSLFEIGFKFTGMNHSVNSQSNS